MELQQLRYVVAVARTGNFSRAAEQCHVAQPSLSQQIQKLEDELGERLFARLPREARLTEAGEHFVPRARRILAEVDAAQRELHDAHGRLRGRVTVGVLPTIAPYFLPEVIAAYSAAHPEVEAVVQEDTTTRLLKQGRDFELDLAIVSLPIDDPQFERENLFNEELLLALPPSHPLAARRQIRFADLENERFILMKEGHCLGDQVLAFCSRRDFRPRVTCRSAQVETVQALVQVGLGVSLVPQMAIARAKGSGAVYRSLDNPRPTRAITVVWPGQRALSRAAGEFLNQLRKTAKSRRQPNARH